MKEEREIRTVLHDGSEVIMNTEERVIFQSSRPGAIPLSVDADTVFDDVLITLDQANQQLTEKDATIKREYTLKHEAYNNLTRCHETIADNAEEIARLRKALEDARDSIQVIEAHGERPWEVTSYCDRAIELIDDALGEGDKE